MSVQLVVVGLIVLACALQAAWTLMPGRLRASVATLLLKTPLHWPAGVAARLRKAASGAGSGCASGCDSCSSAAPGAAGGAASVKPITIHRRATSGRVPPSP